MDFPEDTSMRISHEAINLALYVQGRGTLRREPTACLHTGRASQKSRQRVRNFGKSFVTPKILISERPPCVKDRAVPGHWVGALIKGLESYASGTLVERSTRFTICCTFRPIPTTTSSRAISIALHWLATVPKPRVIGDRMR